MLHFETSAKCKTRGKGKNKLPVTSLFFWLFHPPIPTNIDWQWWCQKDQWKNNPLTRKLSPFWQPETPTAALKTQEITTARTWITFNNARLRAAKKKIWCPNTAARKNRGKTVVQKNSKVTFHIITSLWVVFFLSTLNFKKLVNQAFPHLTWKQSKKFLNISSVFLLFLEHLEINEELSLTASSKNCMTAILFQTIIPESHQNNASSINQFIGVWRSCSECGKSQNNGLIPSALFFLLPSSHDLCLSHALCKMPHLPCSARKAPFMQATTDVVCLSSVFFFDSIKDRHLSKTDT